MNDPLKAPDFRGVRSSKFASAGSSESGRKVSELRLRPACTRTRCSDAFHRIEWPRRARARNRGRRLQTITGSERNTSLAILLHAVGVTAVPEHPIAAGAEHLVLVHTVVRIPHPAPVAHLLAAGHHASERFARREAASDTAERLHALRVGLVCFRWVCRYQDSMPLVQEARGKARTGENLR